MMRIPFVRFILFTALIILSGCVKEYPESLKIEVKNETDIQRNDEAVFLDIAMLKDKPPDFNPQAFYITAGEDEIPSQPVDMDGDGKVEKIVLICNFSPGERKTLNFRYEKEGLKEKNYTKRTQAVLSRKKGGKWVEHKYEGGEFKDTNYLKLPPEQTDHSEFIRFEGVGWESDKVGYRLYLDWRNAIDIFGKKTSNVVLQDVGHVIDSYHEMAPWGLDILKVGDALGMGAVGMWREEKARRVSKTDSVICKIVADGPVYSHIRIDYYGWKLNSEKYHLTSDLSISAGSRLTEHKITIREDVDNLCTGIVKSEQAEIIKSEDKESGWNYLATYGKQSIIEDGLGMAILYRSEDKVKITEDHLNNIVVLNPDKGELTYYFLAAWQQESEGIKTEKEFIDYLERKVRELDTALSIHVK